MIQTQYNTSVPYTSQNGQWGADWGSWGMNATAGGSGPINSTYEWQPDYQGEPPPPQVIVAETCAASWGADAGSGAFGSADNGLGFPEQPNGDGSLGGISSGTRYQVMPGAQTIPLSVNPSVSMTTPIGTIAVSVWYSARVDPLDILLSGGIGQNAAKRYLIGQQAGGSLTSGSLTPDPNSYNWTVSGCNPFLNYVIAANSSSATFTAFSAQTTTTLACYFAGPAGQGTVTCTAHLNVPADSLPQGGINVTVTRQCSVDVPECTVVPSIGNTKVRLDPDGSQWLDLDMMPTDPNGTLWKGHVKTPPEYTNQYGYSLWGFAQLWTPERTIVKNGQSLHWTTNGTTGLDSGFPYLNWLFKDDGSEQTGKDRPETELLSTMTSATAADSFTTYVMYEPPGATSVYVPLRYWTWSWIGETSRATITDPWGAPTDESVLGGPIDYPHHPTWTTQIDPNGGTWVP